MPDSISVVIPAHNEEAFITRCLESVRVAEKQVGAPVEMIVVLNRCMDRTESIAREHGARTVQESARCLSTIRNAGVRAGTGDIVVTIDADSWMSDNMLVEVQRRLTSGRYIGGGVRIVPERLSLGIVLSCMTFVPKLLLARCWAGLFWLRRDTFEAIDGFDEEFLSAEDVDFARRLREYGAHRDLRYGLIRRAHITTSCRKFDQFGDWYLLRNRRLVQRLLGGRDRKAADHFYYNVRE